jgi:predicted nucleic acid-binding protein
MPDSPRILVINTTPLIALAIATGGLDVLSYLYDCVLVPQEVEYEILAAGNDAPGASAFLGCSMLERLSSPQNIPVFLQNTLDRGEAAVIQAAIQHQVSKVCIDEKVGRRIARLNGLTVTGSIGVLAKARQQGFALNANEAIARLRSHGIWLGREVEQFLREKCVP